MSPRRWFLLPARVWMLLFFAARLAIAEVPVAQNHFHKGESAWISWRSADELRFP